MCKVDKLKDKEDLGFWVKRWIKLIWKFFCYNIYKLNINNCKMRKIK